MPSLLIHPLHAQRRRRAAGLALGLLLALASAGCSSWRLDRAAQTATGFASHVLCDEVFISGNSLEQAFAQRIRPMPGQGLVTRMLHTQLDPVQQEVQVSLAGAFRSRARFSQRDGCQVIVGEVPLNTPPNDGAAPVQLPDPDPGPDPDGAQPVAATSARLQAALASALPQPVDAHHTLAMVVLHRGRLVGERYAPGITPDTALLGFSASKSISNALVGVLVQQGRLETSRQGLLPAWADPGDARHAITVEQLLRQTSGLDLLQDNSGFDASAQIMFTVRDKAAAAAAAPLAAPPGQRWAYADTNYLLLSRVLRDVVGGDAEAVRGFMQQALFGPLGMRRARMDIDATGTGMGAAQVSATARDWARFGQLFLDDGMRGGMRLLPAGWVAWSTTPTLDTGYGAGWWTNRVAGLVPGWGVPWGLPSAPVDAFFARGFMGQYVVVVPSRQLVLVRLSSSHQRGDDIIETDRIMAAVLAALAD